MADVDDFDVTQLPWDEILEELNLYYYEILEGEFGDDEEVFELLKYTQIGVQYDPELVGVDQTPSDHEETTFWDRAGAEVTRILYEMLIEKYNVQKEYAMAIETGHIGVAFLSHVASSGQCCTEWYTCNNGRQRIVCCPC